VMSREGARRVSGVAGEPLGEPSAKGTRRVSEP
jgi:hypothetical protein